MKELIVEDFVLKTFLNPSKLLTKFESLNSSESINNDKRGSNMYYPSGSVNFSTKIFLRFL